MNVLIEFWQLISLFGTFIGLLFAAGKVLLTQMERHQSERDRKQEAQLDTLINQVEKEGETIKRLERDFLHFQADLPIQYVRREDYVRSQTVIEAKLDTVAFKIENLQMKDTQR
ncbi:hypothetical protein AAHK20_01110 [Trinickia sp. YCB016]